MELDNKYYKIAKERLMECIQIKNNSELNNI